MFPIRDPQIYKRPGSIEKITEFVSGFTYLCFWLYVFMFFDWCYTVKASNFWILKYLVTEMECKSYSSSGSHFPAVEDCRILWSDNSLTYIRVMTCLIFGWFWFLLFNSVFSNNHLMTTQKTQVFWLFNSVFSNDPLMTTQKTHVFWLFSFVFSSNPVMAPQKTQVFWLFISIF
jgi:hypothetical protein